MNDLPDARLLEEFVHSGSEEAFATLVERYIALVHSTALRHTDNFQEAQDITQAVFIVLAHKAASLGRRVILPGWLYHTTRLTAANIQRAEARRLRREQEAFMQSKPQEPATDALWSELSPQLDKAMATLNPGERDALVLRYFQNMSMTEVGQSLGLAQNTAQKRICRALEKLHRFFNKRGVTSTTAIIAQAISVNSVQAVPAAMAKSVTAMALAKGATASSSTLTLFKGALKVMAWTKAKATAVAGTFVLLALGTATITVKEVQAHKTYSWQTRVPNYELLMPPPGKSSLTVPPQVRILAARYPSSPGGYAMGGGGLIGLNQPAMEVVRHSFGDNPHDIYSTNLEAELPRGSYDFIANLPGGESEDFNALRQKLKEDWGVVGKPETLKEVVMMLKAKPFSAPDLRISTATYYMIWRDSARRLECRHATLSDFANLMGLTTQFPIVNGTGLSNFYDFNLNCNYTSVTGRDWNQVNRALDPLGLELVPTNIPVEMLVVEKAE